MLLEEKSSRDRLMNCTPENHSFSDFALRLNLKYVIQYLSRLELNCVFEDNDRRDLSEEAQEWKQKARRNKLKAWSLMALTPIPLLFAVGLFVMHLQGSAPPGWSLFLITPALGVTCLGLAIIFLWREKVELLRAQIILSAAQSGSKERFSQAREEMRPWIDAGYIAENPIGLGNRY